MPRGVLCCARGHSQLFSPLIVVAVLSCNSTLQNIHFTKLHTHSGVAKANLPQKICVVCQRPFTWCVCLACFEAIHTQISS